MLERNLGVKKDLYQCSPLVHSFNTNCYFCLYDRARVEYIYGNESLAEIFNCFQNPASIEEVVQRLPMFGCQAVIDLISELIAKEFILPEYMDGDDIVKGIIRQRKLEAPEIDNIFLYLTERCNYRCKYCYVRANVGEKTHDMSEEVADKFVRLLPALVKGSPSKDIYIIFYGGEPLLEFDMLKYIVEKVESESQVDKLRNKNIQFRLVTNGSLVTEHTANYLFRHNVRTAVSIDGQKAIHDKMRVLKNGEGSYSHTIRGYNILKEYGFGEISLSISVHNVLHLKDVTKYLVEELGAKAIRFNVPEGFLNNTERSNRVSFTTLADNLIEAFDFLVERGIPSTNIGANAFIDKRPNFYPCNGCGKRLALSPDGDVSPCESFLTGRRHILGNILDSNFSIYNNDIFLKWLGRSGYLMDECKSCEALGICGGGCAYNAETFNGGFFKPDITICDFARKMLAYLIGKPIRDGNFKKSYLDD